MVEHTGKTLGVDLHRLLFIARDRIPGVARYYLDSNRLVAATADTDGWAFGDSRVGQTWMELRDEYQAILGRTADNLIDTATALERVVDHYASTDEAAAAELRRLIVDHAITNPDMAEPQTNATPEPKLPMEQ